MLATDTSNQSMKKDIYFYLSKDKKEKEILFEPNSAGIWMKRCDVVAILDIDNARYLRYE